LFASQGQAKSFFVDRIAEQARAEGSPLSPNQQWMLRFSESDPDFVVDPIRVNQVDAEISDSDYETKITSLLERAYERDTKADPAVAAKYREASEILHQGDHYLLIMIDRAIGDRLGSRARTTLSRTPLGFVERGFEIVLGGLLLLLLPVPLVGAVGAVVSTGAAIFRGIIRDAWPGLLALPITGFLAWFCAVVGWRLVTGRRPPNGRLMPAWLLYGGAFLGTMVAFRSTQYGPEALNRDMKHVSESLAESLGRNRSEDSR
jgi:hypothetical protein